MHGVMQCKGSAWLRRSWRSIFDVFKSFLLKRFFNVLTVFKIIFPTFSHLCSSQIRRRCCFKRENSDFWAAAVEVVSWKCLPSTEGDWNAARRPKHRKYLSLCLILNNTEQSHKTSSPLLELNGAANGFFKHRIIQLISSIRSCINSFLSHIPLHRTTAVIRMTKTHYRTWSLTMIISRLRGHRLTKELYTLRIVYVAVLTDWTVRRHSNWIHHESNLWMISSMDWHCNHCSECVSRSASSSALFLILLWRERRSWNPSLWSSSKENS